MKTKNLFAAIAVSMSFALGFTSCLGDGNETSVISRVSPVVIESSNLTAGGGIFLYTGYGIFIPNNTAALELSQYPQGSCFLMSFSYSTENQIDGYCVASNIIFRLLDTDYASEENAEMVKGYTYPFTSVDFVVDNNGNTLSLSDFYKGRLFIAAKAKLAQNQFLNYYYYVKPDEQPDASGAKNIYLQAKLSGDAITTAQDASTVCALDMRGMIYSSGKDTTVYNPSTGAEYSYRFMKINLKYCYGMENETPLFKSISTQPIYISILKED